MQELKDTQNEADDRNLPIDRVGVKALRFPVEVREKGGGCSGRWRRCRWRWICPTTTRGRT